MKKQEVCAKKKVEIRQILQLLPTSEEIMSLHFYSLTKMFGLEEEESIKVKLLDGMMELPGITQTGKQTNQTIAVVERIVLLQIGEIMDRDNGTIGVATTKL